MSSNTYSCPSCSFKEEYFESISISKDQWHPEICPNCGKGKLEKVFDMKGHGGFDVVGGYDYQYGKKNWKKNLNDSDKAKVLSGKINPY